MTVMLYAHPGPHKLHGDEFDYIVVDEKKVGEAIEKGWSLTTPEALEKSNAPATDEVVNDDAKAEAAAAKKAATAAKRKATIAAKKAAAEAEAQAAAEADIKE
jgi:hypothetical protein